MSIAFFAIACKPLRQGLSSVYSLPHNLWQEHFDTGAGPVFVLANNSSPLPVWNPINYTDTSASCCQQGKGCIALGPLISNCFLICKPSSNTMHKSFIWICGLNWGKHIFYMQWVAHKATVNLLRERLVFSNLTNLHYTSLAMTATFSSPQYRGCVQA